MNQDLKNLPKILIVDDTITDHILYKEYLGEFNYQFYGVEDGDQVLDFLDKNIPDLIILDWQMPRIEGLSVLKLVRNNRRYMNIPIIVVTGMDQIEVLEQAFDYGANDFLIKPVSEKEIIVRVQNVIRSQQKIKTLDKENIALADLNEIIENQNQKLHQEQDRLSSFNLIEKVKLEKLIKKIEANLNIVEKEGSDTVAYYKAKVKMILSDIRNVGNLSLDSEQIVNKEIYKKLLKINPSLTNLDLQHCHLLSQNLRNDEIAQILFVELKTLQTKRYRLKKKLGLEKDLPLRNFLIEL